MPVPILSSAAERMKQPPPLLVHFKDGSIATLDDIGMKMRDRHLDQIERIELYPHGGQQVDGGRDGMAVRGLTMNVGGLPFAIWAIFPLQAAMNVGQILAAPPNQGNGAVVWTP